jgi:hypothetical protein
MALDTAIAQFRQQLDTLPQCVILAAPKMPPEDDLKVAVRDILEGGDDPVYSDGIESIDRAEIIDEAIEGEFSDRIGVRSIKRVGFRITPESIRTWLLNPDEVAKFSLYQADVLALFAPMFGKGSRAGKTKKCTKGLECGGACLRRLRADGTPTVCKKTPNPETKAKIERAINNAAKALFESMQKTDAVSKKYTDMAKALSGKVSRLAPKKEMTSEDVKAISDAAKALFESMQKTDAVSKKYTDMAKALS